MRKSDGVERAAKVRTSGEIPSFRREDRRSECKKDRWYLPSRGFTIIELMISMAIMVILAAMATLLITSYRERAQVARAMADLHTLQNEIDSFQIDKSRLPVDLSEVNWDTHLDPWDHPYQYTNFETVPKGKWRKDKFLVPINSGFDLWSMGPDGKSLPPLTAPVSKDDIIRANDGAFIGRASLY
jgi:general secretion pathway protein G